MPRAQVPKLIHPLPPNEVRVPKGNGSDAEDIEEEPPTPPTAHGHVDAGASLLCCQNSQRAQPGPSRMQRVCGSADVHICHA